MYDNCILIYSLISFIVLYGTVFIKVNSSSNERQNNCNDANLQKSKEYNRTPSRFEAHLVYKHT